MNSTLLAALIAATATAAGWIVNSALGSRAELRRRREHHNAWRVTHLRWKKDQVPYSWHSKVNWPMNFEMDVIESYERLKNLQIQMAGLVRGLET